MIGVSGQYPPNKVTGPTLSVQITCNDVNMKDVKVELSNRKLWSEFFQAGTEMILTKLGRRMFPDLQFIITGLEPTQYYFVLMDIVPADEYRYKFMGKCWMPAFKSDAPPHKANLYCHPDSPSIGAKWTSTTVAFSKLKLTNNISPSASSSLSDNLMVLNSMHRYMPRLHLFRGSDIARLDPKNFTTFCFPETTFMAVTAYQNDAVTLLKIKFNPFAKGFRDDDRRHALKRTAIEACVQDEAPDVKTAKEDLSSSSQETSCPSSSDSPAPESSGSESHVSPVPSAVPPLPPSPFASPFYDPALPFRTPFDPRFFAAPNYQWHGSWRDILPMHPQYTMSAFLPHGAAQVTSPYMPYIDPRIKYPD